MVNEALLVLESEVVSVLALNTLGESMKRYGELLMVSLDLDSVLVDACRQHSYSTYLCDLTCVCRQRVLWRMKT